jgi:hypothetical protein
MADTFKGVVSMTPVVTIAAGSDADADAIDVIHHDINKTLGGNIEWNAGQQVGTARWFYAAATVETTISLNLISGNYTDGTAVSTDDDVRMVYIEHLGVDSSGATSASGDYLFIYLDGGNNSDPDAICLEPGESIVLKFKLANGVDVANLHGDMAQNTAKVKVVAICDDGA